MDNIPPWHWLKHQTQSSIKTYKNHLCQTAAIALKGWSSITGLFAPMQRESDCWCVFFCFVCVCRFCFDHQTNVTMARLGKLVVWRSQTPEKTHPNPSFWQGCLAKIDKNPSQAKHQSILIEKNGLPKLFWKYCWWFRNPANQLRLVVYPMIYKVLAPSQVVISEPSTVWYVSINAVIVTWLHQVSPS